MGTAQSLFVIGVSAVNFLGCTKEPPPPIAPTFKELKDKMVVGMTYDEVEKILGKPSSISRGFNELVPGGEPALNSNEISYINTLIRKNNNYLADSSCWIFPKKVESRGQLLYVTWIYPETRIDSFYALIPTYETVKWPDTTYFIVIDSSVKIEVYEFEFDRLSLAMCVEYKEDESYVTEAFEDCSMPPILSSVKKGKITKMYKKLGTNETYRISGVTKKYYKTVSNFSILFDSSSGRLVKAGYFPLLAVAV